MQRIAVFTIMAVHTFILATALAAPLSTTSTPAGQQPVALRPLPMAQKLFVKDTCLSTEGSTCDLRGTLLTELELRMKSLCSHFTLNGNVTKRFHLVTKHTQAIFTVADFHLPTPQSKAYLLICSVRNGYFLEECVVLRIQNGRVPYAKSEPLNRVVCDQLLATTPPTRHAMSTPVPQTDEVFPTTPPVHSKPPKVKDNPVHSVNGGGVVAAVPTAIATSPVINIVDDSVDKALSETPVITTDLPEWQVAVIVVVVVFIGLIAFAVVWQANQCHVRSTAAPRLPGGTRANAYLLISSSQAGGDMTLPRPAADSIAVASLFPLVSPCSSPQLFSDGNALDQQQDGVQQNGEIVPSNGDEGEDDDSQQQNRAEEGMEEITNEVDEEELEVSVQQAAQHQPQQQPPPQQHPPQQQPPPQQLPPQQQPPLQQQQQQQEQGQSVALSTNITLELHHHHHHHHRPGKPPSGLAQGAGNSEARPSEQLSSEAQLDGQTGNCEETLLSEPVSGDAQSVAQADSEWAVGVPAEDDSNSACPEGHARAKQEEKLAAENNIAPRLRDPYTAAAAAAAQAKEHTEKPGQGIGHSGRINNGQGTVICDDVGPVGTCDVPRSGLALDAVTDVLPPGLAGRSAPSKIFEEPENLQESRSEDENGDRP